MSLNLSFLEFTEPLSFLKFLLCLDRAYGSFPFFLVSLCVDHLACLRYSAIERRLNLFIANSVVPENILQMNLVLFSCRLDWNHTFRSFLKSALLIQLGFSLSMFSIWTIQRYSNQAGRRVVPEPWNSSTAAALALIFSFFSSYSRLVSIYKVM